MFQFQYGAIGRGVQAAAQKLATAVSIPVWCDWEPCNPCRGYRKHRSFNSSMVRLGARRNRSNNTHRRRFNSSMVRLGEEEIGVIIHTDDVSIPVWCDWEWIVVVFFVRFVFVSIPVWCDWEFYAPLYGRSYKLFQFQYGAIGSIHWGFCLSITISFNSSMVRLGVLCPLYGRSYRLFQFQYGAIGRISL